MRTQPRSSRRISFFNNCLNSAWRLALIGSIVFGVAFVVGYTATAAAPVVLNGVVNSKRGDSQSTSERAATKGVLVRHTNRDLNQPLSASSLLGIFEAKVSTDKADYRPGETAIITGSGFWANEIVTLQVVHVDGGEEDGAGHEPWNVAADADGNFTSSWFVNPDDSLGATFVLTAVGNSSGLTAQTTFTDKPAANLDQCANGGVGDTPVQCAGAAWQNGNLNGNQAHYLEGQTVPYRAVFTDLTAGATYTTTIQYDTTQDGKHATDYLMTFNATEVTADPCTGSGVPSCAAPTTFPIPLDPNVSGAGVTQVPGQNFTMYNGSISIVSAYTLTGTYAGTSKTSITLTFSPTADGTAVIAWGGHISTRIDWGVGNSAIAIDGAPYHMRLIGFTCSNVANCSVGNQDRSLAAGAIFFPAILNITKVTVPSPQTTAKLFAYTATGTDVSNFSLDDDPNTATSNTKSFSLTDTSSRSITEGDPSPEFTFTDLMCNQVPDPQLNDTGTVNIDLGARSVTVTPAEGETINCTYVNTQGGKIIIKKETNPDGDPQSFTFTASYDVDGFSLKDGEQNDSGFLSVGNYSVSETVPSGWDMTSSCVSSKGDNESAGSISLQAGETVTCTFTNTKRGHIVVDKVTNPSGDSQSFNFDAGGGSYADFSLTDAAAPNDQTLVPGNYSVSETVPAGWDLTDTSCTSSIGDTESAGALELDAGETITCTFTNTKRGHIVVDKVTNPSGDSQSFNFDAGGGSYADFSLTDAAAPNDQELAPGNYSVSETVPAGWDLTDTSCTSSIGDTESAGALELDAGETITCTFTNTKRGHIVVDKVTHPSGDSQSFNFDAGGGSYADFSLTDAAAPNDQELVPGNYSVSETVPAGWDLTSATCSDGSNPNSISLQAGETVTCTFTNTKRGTIIVEKQTNPDAASGSFTFTGTAAGIIGDGQTITVPNLVPGTYYSTENDPTPNFDLTSISCNDGSSARVSTGDVTTRKATFRLDPGETVKCTFTNTQRGMVEVLKITNGAANPNLDIKFTLYKDGPDLDPDLTGTDTELETLSTLGDADGLLQFTTKLVPDTKYTVCENPVPAGWTSLWMISFSVNGTIVTPYNPNGNDSPAQDLGIRCFDFTVTPGQTKSFEVHNDFPGGDPRTIGYWKNWNRCTGGGQAANADKNGGPAAGFFLVDNLLPQLIGDFNVTTCAQAVKILSKQDQAGKSKSSDAAYELAAQLLAAKLNLAAGAETCAAVQSAVVNGQALLDQINFSGSGDYLGSKAKGAQLTQRNQALSLANTLDQYNNGNLCP